MVCEVGLSLELVNAASKPFLQEASKFIAQGIVSTSQIASQRRISSVCIAALESLQSQLSSTVLTHAHVAQGTRLRPSLPSLRRMGWQTQTILVIQKMMPASGGISQLAMEHMQGHGLTLRLASAAVSHFYAPFFTERKSCSALEDVPRCLRQKKIQIALPALMEITGLAEGVSSKAMSMSGHQTIQRVSARKSPTFLSIVSSWKKCWDVFCFLKSRYTTRTVSAMTIDLRTWNCGSSSSRSALAFTNNSTAKLAPALNAEMLRRAA